MADARYWLLVFGTLLALTAALAVKAPCLYNEWEGFQYWRMCYNDVQALYASRGMDTTVLPYVGDGELNPDGTPRGFVEYPVLTGLFMYAAARLSHDGTTFFLVNALLLAPFALATTHLLFRMLEDKRRAAFWAAGSPLILYSFHNWDLLAVFFSILGVYLYGKERLAASGLALAAGASAKLYPGLFVPFLAIMLLRHRGNRITRVGRFVGAFLAGAAAVNLPFLLVNPTLFAQTYVFHFERPPNPESLWFILDYYAHKWDIQGLARIMEPGNLRLITAVVGLGLGGGILFASYRGTLRPEASAFAALLTFLLLNKIFSVQYALWALPFFAVVPLSKTKFAAFALADLFAYWAVFNLELKFWYDFNEAMRWLSIAVVLRAAVFLWILIHLFRGRPSASGAPKREPGPTISTSPAAPGQTPTP